ncbi:exonuclease DPD1, chloroplastic/mitochondrial [Quercus suber]
MIGAKGKDWSKLIDCVLCGIYNYIGTLLFYILDGLVSKSDTFSVNKTEISQFQNIEYCDIRQKIAENKELASLVTVIVFDIETTGFSRENERIIEIALRDLEGGENSTFQTLVNPQRFVPNSHVHGITTRMVNKADVPRMEDLIPILLQFVRSRQKPGGYVVLAAHNARSFDVPFLRSEFTRCKAEFPSNWLFVDTLTLAREMMKSKGEKSTSISLQALRQSFEIPLTGKAHRAMADVDLLSIILPRLTFVLKWSISDLIMKSFLPSDSPKSKKKSLR